MNQKAAVAVVYVAALFMSIMDTTIVNVALPTIGRDFHVAPTSVSSVSISFLVSLAVFIPVSGWLGDRIGNKRVLLGAIAIFTLASALCGIAQNIDELVAFRILQGLGGGMMTPVGLAMLFRVYPPAERIRASSLLVVPTALAPAAGPVLGGLLVTDLTWRWVFFVNLPIGAVVILFGLLFLHEMPQAHPGRFDLRGFLLAGIGLGLLMYGLSEGPSMGWDSASVLTAIALGLVLLGTLVSVELRRDEPLIDLRLLSNDLFRLGTIVVLVTMAALIGTLYVITLFYQDARGLSPLAAGLSTFPEALGVMAGSQIAAHGLIPAIGPRRSILAGNVGLAASLALLAVMGPGTSLWVPRALLFVAGIALGHVIVPTQATSFATISPRSTSRASTMFNAVRQLGGAIGVAAFTTVVVGVGARHVVAGSAVPNFAAYRAAFIAAAGFALAGGLFTAKMRDSDLGETAVAPAGRSARAEEESALVIDA